MGLKPREQTCLGSSIAAAGGRLEGRKLQASQRAKQKHTGAGSDCLRLPAPSPSPHARARDKEATRGREKGGGRSGAVSEHAPRRRRADLPESGAGSAALTVSASRPRDLTPRRPLRGGGRRDATRAPAPGSGDEVTCPAHSGGSPPPAAQRPRLLAALLLPFQVTTKFALFLWYIDI